MCLGELHTTQMVCRSRTPHTLANMVDFGAAFGANDQRLNLRTGKIKTRIEHRGYGSTDLVIRWEPTEGRLRKKFFRKGVGSLEKNTSLYLPSLRDKPSMKGW